MVGAELLGRAFPGLAARWYLKRAQLAEAARLYDLATGKYSDRYPALSGRGYSADAVNNHAGQKVRDYARYLDENSDIAIGILDTLADQVAPVEPEPMVVDLEGRPVARLNDALAELWQLWTRSADVTAAFPWGEYKRITARAWLRDGDVFTRHLRGAVRGVVHRSPVPYALQLLEADYCPVWMTDELTGAVQGVRLNRWGRRTGYYLYRRHPGGVLPAIAPSVRQDVVLVNPEDLAHLMYARRVQVRGQSIFAGVGARLLDVKNYDESERIAARVASSFAAVIKRAAPFGGVPRYTAGGSRAMQLEDGMIMDMLGPGEELQIVAPSRPNPNLGEFRREMLKSTAAGTRASYSTISKDYSGTYASQRQALVEQRPAYDALRDYWVGQWLDPVYRNFVAMAVAAGAIDATGFELEQLSRAHYAGTVIPWIDPLKEVQADALAVTNGFKSRQQVIRERGYDVRRVDREREIDDFEPPSAAPDPAEQPDEEETANAED